MRKLYTALCIFALLLSGVTSVVAADSNAPQTDIQPEQLMDIQVLSVGNTQKISSQPVTNQDRPSITYHDVTSDNNPQSDETPQYSRQTDAGMISTDELDPPTFTDVPLNLTGAFAIELGALNAKFNKWRMSDANPDRYYIMLNDTTLFVAPTPYVSQTNIQPPIVGFDIGMYKFTIFVNDTFGNTVNDTKYARVVDTTLPAIVSQPIDFSITTGNTTSLQWDIDDLDATNYSIFIDSQVVQAGNYSSSVLINYTVPTTLTPGVHTLQLHAQDRSGNTAISTVIITVVDPIFPELISSPVQTAYEFGSTGINLTWNAGDSAPGTYTLYRNGSVLSSASWDNSTGINSSLDGLSIATYNYTIVIRDSSNNTITDQILITVADTTAPDLISISPPSNVTVPEQDDSLLLITWTPTDFFPATYNITRNGALITLNAFWFSSNPINQIVDTSLSTGIYEYILFAKDDYGNIGNHSVFVHVVDNTIPSITSPGNSSFSEGTTGNFISWSATDNHPSSYELFLNEILWKSGAWTGGSISFNLDSLTLASNNLTIIFVDESGNEAKDTVFVFLSDQPIFFSLPEAREITNQTSGETVSWVITDSNPGYYNISRNGTIVFEGNWANGIPLTVGIDNATVAIYIFTIWLNDTDNNFITHSVQINVTDIPQVSSVVYDTIIEEGSTGNDIVWTATDLAADSYTVTSNITGGLTPYDSGDWTSGLGVTTSIDGLLKGFYEFTITFTDIHGNTNSSSVVVQVNDNILPAIADGFTPTNMEYDDGSGGNEITWKTVENNPDIYIIYRDELQQETGPYLNNTIISIDIDGLDIGSYIYKLTLRDTSGNEFNTTVVVTVNDITNPTLNQPSNVQLVENTAGVTLTWTAVDENPTNYTVYRNDTGLIADFQVEFNTYLSGQSIEIDISALGLAIGIYNFTIIVRDVSGNMANNTVIIIVTDIPEIISTPSDLEFDETETSRYLNWTAVDSHPTEYLVTITPDGSEDTQIFDSGSWSNATRVSVDIASIGVGVYEIMIIFEDLYGNSINDTRILVVLDTTAPTFLEQPENTFSITEGSTGNVLLWKLEDTNSATYEIHIDDVSYDVGTWETNESIIINFDELLLGSYSLNFTAVDSSGNTLISLVEISVSDTNRPSLNDHQDLQMSEGSSDNVVVWISTELHPDTYEVYVDGSLDETGSWQSGRQIIIDIDFLTKGTYNYTIVIYDTSGNQNSDQLLITVIDSDQPIITTFNTQLLQYIEGSTNNLLQIVATDTYPNNYTLLLDGIAFTSGTWADAVIQSIDINNLAKGVYNLTLLIWDESNNQAIETLFIEVFDTRAVVIIQEPSPEVVMEENSQIKYLEWIAEDLYPNYYEVSLNNTPYETDNWTNDTIVRVDFSELLLGAYLVEIKFYDHSDNFVISIVEIEVIDRTSPQEISSSADENNQFVIITNTTGNFMTWEFRDNHPESYAAELDGVTYAQGVWANNVSIQIQVDGLTFGVYNLSLKVEDTSNNLFETFVILKVNDPAIIRTKAPELSIRSQAREGDLERHSGLWMDETSSMIESGTIHLSLWQSDTLNTEYSTGFANNQWNIILNYTSQFPGSYHWEILFSSPGYESQLIILSVNIISHRVNIDVAVSDTQNVVQGSPFTILISVNYQNQGNNSSLILNQEEADVVQREGGVSDAELLVIIVYEDLNGDRQTLERAAVTDESGAAVIILEGDVTANMAKLVGIMVSFEGSQSFESMQYEKEDVDIESLPPRPNQIEAFLIFLGDVVEIIIVALLTSIAGGLLLWFYIKRRTKKINEILENVSNDHEEIISMMEIKAIILQNHGGIPIYLEESGHLGVDGVLISGFSKAISTFLDEIERSVVTGFESIQRDTFAINSFSTGLGRIILLANESLPDIMKIRMIEIMTEVERTYSQNLHGGISLRPRDFEEIVANTNLKYTLLHKFTLNRRSIASALKLRSLSRTAKENFKFLLEFSDKTENKELTLEKLYNVLRSRLLPPTLVTQIISVGYSLRIFSPLPKGQGD